MIIATWWDNQLGTYMAQHDDGTVIGTHAGHYPTPQALAAAVGGLDAAVLAALQAQHDAEVAVAPPAARTLSRLEFLSRFTGAEKAAILAAGDASPALRVYLFDLQMATEVRLDSLATIGGVQALEAAGLIAPGRSQEILA